MKVGNTIKVWFAARYLPHNLQTPVAVGFVAAGLLCVWGAEAIRRRHPSEEG